MTVLKKFLKRLGGFFVVFALMLCVCADIPDFCGNGGRYDPATQFCVGDRAFDKCGGDEYNPVTHGCESGVVTPITPPIRQFTIFFNTNGGTPASISPVTVDSGGVMGQQYPADPERAGHIFDGWFDGATQYTYAMVITGSVMLTAKWTEPTYEVTVLSEGTGAMGGREYTAGTTVIITAGIAPAGQLFKNWTTESDNVTFSDANNLITTFTMPANAVTVTANFESILTYEVMVSSVGTGAGGTGYYVAGATVTVTSGAAPAGQQFRNWTVANGGVTFADANNQITTFTMPNNAVTVTANFEPLPTYEVVVSSVGIGAGGANDYVAGATVTITSGIAPAGQQFRNWTTESSGVTFADANNQITTFIMPANAVTVTANFEPIPIYAVTVESVGSNPLGVGNYRVGTTVTVWAGAAPSGYEFVNWTAEPAVSFDNANSAITAFVMPNAPIKIIANFEALPAVYTVTYNGNSHDGGTVPIDSTLYFSGATVTVLSVGDLKRTNHTFSGWNTAADGSGTSYSAGNAFHIIDNTTLYAKWTLETIQTYAVTVSSAGTGASGSGDYAQGATVGIGAGTPPAGQEFSQWTTTSADVNFVNANNATTSFTMPNNPVTVTANFRARTHLVTVVGGTITGGTNTGDHAVDAMVNITAGTAPAGQQFNGWTSIPAVVFNNANNATTSFTMPNSAVTVTANFTPIFHMVTVSSDGTNMIGSGPHAVGSTVSIDAGAPPAGQEFSQWTTTSADVNFVNANNATTSFTMPNNAVTVTASFVPVTYAVTVESDAGTGVMGAGYYAAGATVNISAGTAPAGQQFNGWTSNSTVTFANAQAAATSFTMPNSAVTVTANFTAVQTFTVTVTANPSNGGSVVQTNQNGTYNAGTEVTVQAVVSSGFLFSGWTGAPAGVNANNLSVKFNINSNVTMVANFTPTITYGSFTDSRNNRAYRTVVMPDGRTWMAENLNFRHPNWSHNDFTGDIGGNIRSGSWCYNNDSSNCNTYGRLYTWDAAMNQACPPSWRLPTLDDWHELFRKVGGSNQNGRWLNAGHALKSSPSDSPSWDGANAHGFSALPGGYRRPAGSFDSLGVWGDWWSATSRTPTTSDAWYVGMDAGKTEAGESSLNKNHGFSVRCLRN